MENHSQPAGNPANTAKNLPPLFFKAMEQEIILSEEMVTILNAEQQALVAVDMPALISLSTRKGALATRLAAMDTQLQEMARAAMGQPQDTVIRLRAIAGLLDPAEASKLEASRLRLASLRNEILSKTIVNRKFTEETRQFLNDALTTITGSMTERPLYGRNMGRGMGRPMTNQPSLISREV